MKFSVSVLLALLIAENAKAFAPQTPFTTAGKHRFTSSQRHMAADLPPASNNLPVIQQNSYGQPTDVRYSDFLKLVTGNRIEKVTFSADGSQLLGVDVDGARVKIEALPNDPSLLTELTSHKASYHGRSTVFSVLSSLILIKSSLLCALHYRST